MIAETLIWFTDGSLPDSDTTVLIATDDHEVHEGFHDGETWRWANAEAVTMKVVAWADMPAGPFA